MANHWTRFHIYNVIYAHFKNYTMLRRKRYILNLKLVYNHRNTRGAIVECGTWRGGMIAGIASLLGKERSYYLFDSFEGLPDAQPIDGQRALEWQRAASPSEEHNNCCADQGEAETAMKRSAATDVHIIKGWFNESLPKYNGGKIALLRLDADWYESTMQCLEQLFFRVVPDGIIIFDDYYTWPGCALAVHEFLSKHERPEGIHQYKNSIAYLIRATKNGVAND